MSEGEPSDQGLGERRGAGGLMVARVQLVARPSDVVPRELVAELAGEEKAELDQSNAERTAGAQ